MIKYPTASERDAHIEKLGVALDRMRVLHADRDARARELEIALDRVRELHSECTARCGLCHECGAQIPCATIRALDSE